MAQPQNSGLSQPKFIPVANENGKQFFPFDIRNPLNYFSCVFSFRGHFNIRSGYDLPSGLETGPGDTDMHLRLSESYSGKELVGYKILQDAVNEVIWKLDKVKMMKKNTNYLVLSVSLRSLIGTIIIMSIEAVTFVWLGNDFYTFFMQPKYDQCALFDGESKLLTSWESISECLEKDDESQEMVQIVQLLTKEMVKKAKTDKRLARSCLGVRQIKVRSEEDKVWLGRGNGVQHIRARTKEDEDQLPRRRR